MDATPSIKNTDYSHAEPRIDKDRDSRERLNVASGRRDGLREYRLARRRNEASKNAAFYEICMFDRASAGTGLIHRIGSVAHGGTRERMPDPRRLANSNPLR
ncbi:hypothetical protein BURK_002315 [Burkholderia sp. SJ98]|uniref:hypothetical protein n=1 Tax=Caballeronia zhejiangensis TaxID=871203 RepID=UPI00025BC7F6|nr:hypothetical protein [Caballeronia zhejiangensis]EKS73264.1 hypothetical protein BURK_002315 [Burkholderia sp. SJ98]